MSTQYNLPPLPPMGESLSKWAYDENDLQAYAMAAIDQYLAARVPDCKVVDVGFRWDGVEQQHVPKLVIEFTPVPYGTPNNGKGWKDRDALAAMLAAAPQPQPVQEQWQAIESAPMDGRTLLLGYFNSSGKWRTMRGKWMSQDYIEEYWEDPEGVEPGWFETCVEADDIPNCWPTDPTHWMLLPAVPLQDTQQKDN